MKKKFVQGLVKRHPDGFGFLIPDDKTIPDIYIPRQSMKTVMSNDRVLAEIEKERGSDRYRGDVVRIVSRGTRKVVGAFHLINDKEGLIRDDGKGWGDDLRVKIEDSLGAKKGQIVAAEILKYPEDGTRFTGKIVEIIGDIEDPLNDIRRVVHGNNIPEEFPAEVLTESKRFPALPEEKDFSGRKDLRSKKLITIDGATAKDFDDAVLVEKTNQGFHLYVAIADVSHYVKLGSAIDKEAYQRGTSVYFPNFVIPMLPEALSNGLCSLNPHVPRLCMVADMSFDFSGTMVDSTFYEAVMESKARVTYGQAQELLDGTENPQLSHVKDVIFQCSDLAKILMKKRFAEGSLDLEIPETELQIDGSGRPTDVIRSERLFAHRLIEELMLAANVAVATFLSSRQVPSLYRVHEPPNELAIRLLERYMEAFGGKTRLGQGKLQKRLTQALEEFKERPEAQVLHILTLRSMSQAKYQPENVGHFGLGFENYSHFTSPIRRYPDLIVHRLLKNQVVPGSAYRLVPQDELATAGTWLSATEQRSVKAERQLMAIKKARFMQQFLGKEFEGLISSVTRFGVFVLLREYDIDGLVRAEEIGNGHWEFDENTLKLVSRRSGDSLSVGDTLKVIVAAADPVAGQVSFMPADMKGRQTKIAPKKDFGSNKDDKKSFDSRPPSFKRKEEKKRGGRSSNKSSGKDSEKRGEAENDRRGLRKTRVSRDGGKGPAGKVSGRKAQRKRRR